MAKYTDKQRLRAIGDFLHYDWALHPITRRGDVPLSQRCNGVTVKNGGNNIVLVNNEPLQPGESKALGGNYGELFRGRVQINFMNQAVQPTPVVAIAYVTEKFYINYDPDQLM